MRNIRVWAWALVALLAAGCAGAPAETPAPSPVPSIKATAAPTTTPPLPQTLAAILALTPGDVEQILRWDDSQPPGRPAARYVSDGEVEDLLAQLQALPLTGPSHEPDATAAPGEGVRYEIVGFDGGSLSLAFGGGDVIADRQAFPCATIPQVTPVLWLSLPADRFPADTGPIRYTVMNDGDETAYCDFTPLLERSTPQGWAPVPSTVCGCGLTGVVEPGGRMADLDLGVWDPAPDPGTYRVTVQAAVGDGEPVTLAAVLILE